MTPEQQQITIAEVCGWTDLHKPQDWRPLRGWMKGRLGIAPDYLNDLNAMRSAEMTLTDDELDERFYYWLGFVVSGGQETGLWKWRKTIVHATAAQRAEAFLKTIGKWKD